MSAVHEIAISGFGEGTNDLYDRARPSYPPQALQKIYEIILESSPDIKKGWKILEPGSGTGIFTKLLIEPPPPHSIPNPTPTQSQNSSTINENQKYPNFPINTLISIEPSEGMRNQWKKSIFDKILSHHSNELNNNKNIKVVNGNFEDFNENELKKIGINNNEIDSIIIAQAWHWCQNSENALKEIASYLKSNSPLILIWNLESFQPEWQKKLRLKYQNFDKGSPQYYKGLWKEMYNTNSFKELFKEKIEWSTKWFIGMTENQLIDRLFSKSYLTSAHLSSKDRENLEIELRNIIKSAPHEWIDKEVSIISNSL
uniref:Methyltransferase type 11 domain-containing protein n=1 Tax=Kwoniella pini CBS 10737 TaxID=1296096 RepID=A0A1B9IB57_9TREE|nr:uncharacterized protein I206_00179 [Kwoniella pini CBS 10737]OCF52878.1 hypothetical protein I206_00179 [Kwoniella pini CBS 10737]